MKKPKKPPPTAKPCIFCPRPRGSKEHFWPQWMHPILPPPTTEPRHNKLSHTFSPFEGSATQGRENTQGALHTIRFRVVCGKCNNGWMNEIETEARPYLAQLIPGETTTLDRQALDAVARWITLKVIVAEHSSSDSAVTPRPLRMAFRNTRAIPDFIRIYLASHDLPFEKSVGYVRHSQAVAFRAPDESALRGSVVHMTNALSRGVPQPSPPLGDVANNVQTLTFYLGRVFVHVTAARVDNFWIEDIASIPLLYETAQIWPPKDVEMTWPREPAFTLTQVDNISESMPAALRAQQPYWVKDVAEL
jgi:hypothetical protein